MLSSMLVMVLLWLHHIDLMQRSEDFLALWEAPDFMIRSSFKPLLRKLVTLDCERCPGMGVYFLGSKMR